MLINYGDFVDGASSKTADPYIQLLPLTTDAAETHSDFVQVRLMGVDSTSNFHLLPASVVPPDNDNSSDDDDESYIQLAAGRWRCPAASGLKYPTPLLPSPFVTHPIASSGQAQHITQRSPAPHPLSLFLLCA